MKKALWFLITLLVGVKDAANKPTKTTLMLASSAHEAVMHREFRIAWKFVQLARLSRGKGVRWDFDKGWSFVRYAIDVVYLTKGKFRSDRRYACETISWLSSDIVP